MLRLGFVSTDYFRSEAIGAWSGLPYHMSRSLACAGAEIVPLAVGAGANAPSLVLEFAYWRVVHRRRFLRDRAPRYLRHLARSIAQRATAERVDAIFAPSSLPLAYLEGSAPAFFWTDATFAGMAGFYDSFSNLCARSLHHGHAAERRALRRAAGAFYASDWAAGSARHACETSGTTIATVAFGANLDPAPDDDEVLDAIGRRQPERPRLLFLGVDWLRKGGPFACDVVRTCRAWGLRAELHIAGCNPQRDELPDEPWIVRHGFIAKDTAEGRVRFAQLLRECDWLILPSRAECFGLVFAEAAAFGVPALATNVGGVASAVADGRTGFLFAASEPLETWAAALDHHARAPAAYRTLADEARREFVRRLNWRVAGQTVLDHVSAIMARKAAMVRRPPTTPALPTWPSCHPAAPAAARWAGG